MTNEVHSSPNYFYKYSDFSATAVASLLYENALIQKLIELYKYNSVLRK